MARPSICQITPRSAVVESTEFNFTNLYLRRNFSGRDRNQLVIQEGGFGETAVNNWSIYDGDGSDAAIVARVQGLHSQAGDWQSTFTIVFQYERFNGSTFEVIGVPTDGGEWAIVGGTGQFAMPTGVISKSVHEQRGDGNTIELTMHGFYLSRSLLTKAGVVTTRRLKRSHRCQNKTQQFGGASSQGQPFGHLEAGRQISEGEHQYGFYYCSSFQSIAVIDSRGFSLG